MLGCYVAYGPLPTWRRLAYAERRTRRQSTLRHFRIERYSDGSIVTVLAREIDESFELDATAEAELLISLAEADRGELIPAEDVLRTFRDLD